jgi:sugar transferase (PEP-CTERM system associated)
MPRPRGFFLTTELVLLGAAVLEAIWSSATFEAPVLIGLCMIAFSLKTLDKSLVGWPSALFWGNLAQALAWAAGAGVLLLFMLPALHSRMRAAMGLFLAAILPVVLRPVLKALVARQKLVEDMLIVGNGKLAEKLHQVLKADRSVGGQQRHTGRLPLAGGVTDFSGLPTVVQREHISRVIVAEEDAQTRATLADVLVTPRLRGLLVNDAEDFYEQFFGKVWVDALNSEWFVYNKGFSQSRASAFLKRCMDIVFAVAMLTVTAPLLLLIAIAIKLDSAGPILFRQERVGLFEKTFVIFKFRSMRQDSEFHGPAWAKECDDRVTRVGRLLRKFYFDELPQAVNVLRGEMSLVGPRPERPCFVERLAQQIPFYNVRHNVKPGITGWAQVKFHYGASVEDASEKLQYDLYYAKYRSFIRDVSIVLKTVKLVLLGKGR